MKNAFRISISILILFMAGCQASANSRLTTPTLMTPTVSLNNDFALKEGFTFSIRTCPFFECEELAQISSLDKVVVTGYDGRSQDLQSMQVWFRVNYNQSGSGWMFINPARMSIPENLVSSLSFAEWTAPTPTPITPTPTLDPDWVKKMLCQENVYSNPDPKKSIVNPHEGYTLRWRTPIKIFPNGNNSSEVVAKSIGEMTNGLITFEIVDEAPAVGIIVNTGDACNPTKSLAPNGDVSPNQDDCQLYDSLFHVGADGYIDSVIYFHMGTKETGSYVNLPGLLNPYAGVEHEFGHALGLGGHYTAFTGYEGFSQEVKDVLIALYSMPSGTDMREECAQYISK
jgi:hypothetical protein